LQTHIHDEIQTTNATITYGICVRKWFGLFTDEEVFMSTEHFINTYNIIAFSIATVNVLLSKNHYYYHIMAHAIMIQGTTTRRIIIHYPGKS